MTSSSAVASTECTLPAFIWDEALIRRYDLSGPRYTSYPTAVEFNQNYPIADMVKAAARYLSIPTCHSVPTFAITAPATK